MAMMLGHEIECHNVSFEKSLWHNVLHKKYGWMIPHEHQWRDTLATAAYYSMPGALDKLARALGFQPKDSEGQRLISRYSKLNLKTAKREIPKEDFEKWKLYVVQDVRIEQSVSDYLGDLPERELPIFLLDQRINKRGLYLDQTGIDHAIAVVDQREAEYSAQFREITGLNPTQVAKIVPWIQQQDVEIENLQAETIEELLEEGDLPQGPARRALELRRGVAKASTKKLDAMSRQRASDGRAKFQVRYHGAGTGRDTGTGFQPLNLKKGFEDVDPAQLVRDISYRNPKWLDTLYGDATAAVANASRHWIQAQDGSRIIAGDFASIEAVVLACLAGEQWKVEAFQQGKPIYETMGAKIHKLPPEAFELAERDKEAFKKLYPSERQDGKTGELAFGYQGALNAWLKFDSSGRHSDEKIIEICRGWRAEHPATVQFWREMESAALEAVLHRGRETGYGEIGFQVVDEWLSMILPNGKRIWYFDPQIRQQMPHWHKTEENEECAAGTCDCRPRPALTYMAWKNKQWRRVNTYGGKLTENAVQATSREILKCSMQALDEAWSPTLFQQGYIEEDESCIVLSIYDEIIAEVPSDFRSIEEFRTILVNPPKRWWPSWWPIRMEAWEGSRYKK
jgi:DNA polymerase